MAHLRKFFPVLLAGSLAILAGCEEGEFLNAGAPQAKAPPQPAVVERDREAPEVFSVEEAGLWDGRPSLGGVWVAHPAADDPLRVMIRNLDNNKFVMGALFRRERLNAGPALQVSSDAAAELGLLAGSPTQMSVVAIVREQVEVVPDVELPENGAIEQTTLDDPVAALAAAAIDNAATPSVKPVPRPVATAVPAAVSAPPTPPAPASNSGPDGLALPFVQIGLFSVQENAEQAMELLRNSGILPTVKPLTSSDGKQYWRVIIGPVTNAAERRQLLSRLEGLGFGDAYPVEG